MMYEEKLKQEITDLKTLNETQADLITELTEENENLKQQLAEKDKRIKELKGKHTVIVPSRKNGKTRLFRYQLLKIQNEQAIEELEKAKEYIQDIPTLEFIDKQIKILKGDIEMFVKKGDENEEK